MRKDGSSMNRMTGYVVKQINCDDSYIEKSGLKTIEDARSYIAAEYLVDAPDTNDNMEYTLNDDVKVVIEKAPTVDELMASLNGLLKGLEEAGTSGWYLGDYNRIKEVLYAVGSVENA